MTLEIELFACLSDNFGVLLHDPVSGATACIDAPDEKPIMDAAAAAGLDTDRYLHHPSSP